MRLLPCCVCDRAATNIGAWKLILNLARTQLDWLSVAPRERWYDIGLPSERRERRSRRSSAASGISLSMIIGAGATSPKAIDDGAETQADGAGDAAAATTGDSVEAAPGDSQAQETAAAAATAAAPAAAAAPAPVAAS